LSLQHTYSLFQINATSSQEKMASQGSESEPVVRDGDVQDQTTTCSSDPDNRENSTNINSQPKMHEVCM